jgi:hypothetical protein
MDGRISAFVDSQDRAELLTGVGRYLRQHDAAVGSPRGGAAGARSCRSARGATTASRASATACVPRNLDVSQPHRHHHHHHRGKRHPARRLARDGGIFCGISERLQRGGRPQASRGATRSCPPSSPSSTTGQRYFTTPLCGEDKHVDIPERDHPLDPHTVEQLDRYQKTWEIIG